MSARTTSEHQQELMQAIEFSADDLKANRAGVLSDWQQFKYRERLSGLRKIYTLLAVSGAIVLAIALPILWSGSNGFDPLIFIGLLILPGLALLLMFRSRPMQEATRMRRQVEAVEGIVNVRLAKPWDDAPHQIRVDGNVLTTQFEKTARVFREGERYRIYYIPGVLGLLSAEWLGDK